MDHHPHVPWDARWISLLACPACHGTLSAADGPELRCASCGRAYPVISRVPAFLIDPTAAELKTLNLYGDIWDAYNQEKRRSRYHAPAASHLELLRLAAGCDIAQGEAGIDAGCGAGHTTLAMARQHAGIRFIGIDLAGGIRRTAAQAQEIPNLRFVQGNLLSPPLAKRAFDFVYSFGVLHHTRDPRGAFLALAERLLPGGRITIFVYKDFSDLPLKKTLLAPVTLIRRLSTRLPAPVLRVLARCNAPAVFLTLTLPARLLRAIGRPRLARHIPYGTFPGIRGIAASLEDRFGAPYEHRFRIADLEGWAREAGLMEWRAVDCLPWGFSGLVLSGLVSRAHVTQGIPKNGNRPEETEKIGKLG